MLKTSEVELKVQDVLRTYTEGEWSIEDVQQLVFALMCRPDVQGALALLILRLRASAPAQAAMAHMREYHKEDGSLRAALTVGGIVDVHA